MNNPFLAAGCDVSADTLDAARSIGDALEHARFSNDATGHAALCRWLAAPGLPVRIVIEASGIYGIDLALALHETEDAKVMILNPRAAKDYRRAHMHRSKTDTLDAAVLCDYALRMPFAAWEPPKGDAVELRQLARRIADLTVERAREKNRLHAASASRASSALVVNDIEVNLRHLDRRIEEMVRQALKLIRRSAALTMAYDRLTSVRGIAAKSAIELLGELLCLPQGMTVREWVAYRFFPISLAKAKVPMESIRRVNGDSVVRGISYADAESTTGWISPIVDHIITVDAQRRSQRLVPPSNLLTRSGSLKEIAFQVA